MLILQGRYAGGILRCLVLWSLKITLKQLKKKKRKSFHLRKSHVFDMTRFEGFIKTISLANKFITNALLFG